MILKKFCLIGLLATGSTVYARSVSVQSFDAPAPSAFSVNGHSAVAKSPAPADVSDSQSAGDTAPDGQLAADFDQLGEGALPVAPGLPSSSSTIPSRSGAWRLARPQPGVSPRNFFYQYRPDSAARSSLFASGLPAADCYRPAYRPKGLRAEVEIRRSHYYAILVETACEVGVPVNLFDALVTQESGYNPYAVSPKGALGITQLMPDTLKTAGVTNAFDIEDNLRGGARILKMHLSEFGRYDLALAAYNAGPGRVRQAGRIPRIRETLSYVGAILADVRRQLVSEYDPRP